MEIKNIELKKYLESLEDGSITMESIDSFGANIDEDGLIEYFKLLEAGDASLFSLKVYSMVYNQDLIAKVNSSMPFNFVDMTFAAMWNEEAEDASVDELKEAALGFVLIGTDLTKRIRNGYKQLDYNLTKFEEQMESLLKSYKHDLDEGVFIKSLSQSDDPSLTDDLLNLDIEDVESLKGVRDRVVFAHAAFRYKDSDSVRERQSILSEIEETTLTEEDLFFLDSKYFSILNDLKMSRAVLKADTDYIEKDSEGPSLGGLLNEVSVGDTEALLTAEEDEEFMDLEVLKDSNSSEGSIIKSLKTMVSSPSNTNKKDFGSLTVKSTRSKKQSSFKWTMFMVFVLMVIGSFLVAVTQKDKTNEDLSIGERVVENQVEETIKEKNFKINRSGTNKSE